MIDCRSCGAPSSNGLALCETCRAAASVYLEFLPVYFRNLARWRPGRVGSRPVPGSREPVNDRATNDRVANALDRAGNALQTWARKLQNDRGITAPDGDDETAQVVALCRWFAENLTSIATLDWCGEFISTGGEDEEEPDGLGYHEAKLRGLTETIVPGWYAGGCHLCGLSTYVVPGLSWVTCGGCGSTTYARDHLEIILDEARDWVAPPRAIASTLVALLDTEMSVPRLYDRIRKWQSLGWLEGVRRVDADGDEVGVRRYQLGEVLDLVTTGADARKEATRVESA